MSVVETLIPSWKFNRDRTLSFLDGLEKDAAARKIDPRTVLAWRPAPGRASVGWQLMHIAITEEIFATERLAPEKPAKWTELLPRFRGGSTPDDDVPAPATIREILSDTRSRMLETVSAISDDRLSEVPELLKEKGWNLRTVLYIIGWHEPHHQGQAHAVLNLFKASHPVSS